MADNLTTANGTVATKDVGGAHHQRFKASGCSQAAYGALTVTTTPTSLIAADGLRRALGVVNMSSVDVYYGTNSSLTTSNGMRLAANDGMSSEYNGAFYFVVASGTAALRYWTEGD